MSCIFAHIAIDDAAVEPLGVKEAMVMALKHLGGVRVLSVELQEPEQMRMAGDTVAPSRPKPKPAPSPRGGQAPARRPPQPQTAMECCDSCGYFRLAKGWDLEGTPYWGICGRTRRPVYDLKDRCHAWERVGG